MGPVSLRAKVSWVTAGYAAVVAVSTLLVVWRYLQYRWHPEDANQYGGMWAGGDMILGVFIFCLFLVPTFFLVLVARKSEPPYIGYAKVLFFLSGGRGHEWPIFHGDQFVLRRPTKLGVSRYQAFAPCGVCCRRVASQSAKIQAAPTAARL